MNQFDTALGAKDRSQGQEAYLRIVDEIRAGDLRPGDRLTETDLADRLGISRTPVREAIRQLESDGLVTHTPRVGTTIRVLSHAEVAELYEMRMVLEATAARFAARAASAMELENLEAIHREMLAEADPVALASLNTQFHGALLDAARNRFLLKSMGAINTTFLILGRTTLEESDRAAEANVEHARILEALTARDGSAAESAMTAHISAAHRARLKQFRAEARDMGRPDGG